MNKVENIEDPKLESMRELAVRLTKEQVWRETERAAVAVLRGDAFVEEPLPALESTEVPKVEVQRLENGGIALETESVQVLFNLKK